MTRQLKGIPVKNENLRRNERKTNSNDDIGIHHRTAVGKVEVILLSNHEAVEIMVVVVAIRRTNDEFLTTSNVRWMNSNSITNLSLMRSYVV